MVTGFKMYSMMIQGNRHIVLSHMISCDLLVRVLYCSLHRYDNATFYPSSPDANYNMVGTNKGVGYNINVAWNWVCRMVTVRDVQYANFHIKIQ